MNVLTISDVVVPFLYSPQVRKRFPQVSMVISCGDLPYYYQEYVLTLLDAPLFFVRGNHDKEIEYGSGVSKKAPGGGADIHRKVINYRGLLIAGVEGSVRYRVGPYQYSQMEMWANVMGIVPRLLRNRTIYGRYLDVFVTHAPPRGVHDQEDLTHQGIDAFRWLIHVFRPRYHIHGHIHLIKPNMVKETLVDQTLVINTYGFREISLDIPRIENRKQ